jgi:pyruvate-formate lyase-activating enzyme
MICKTPYINLVYNSDNTVMPCCRWFISEEGKERFVAKSNKVKDIFESDIFDYYREIVKQDISTIPQCSGCYREESNKISSLRKNFNAVECDYNSPTLKLFEIKMSNICNYSCITCTSRSSTGWFKDTKILQEKYNMRGIDILEKQVINTLDFTGIKLDLFKITGGEPFLTQDLLYRMLNTLNRDCEIWLHTNASIFPNDKVIKLLESFRRVHIYLSIDGYGEVNEYIRYGSNWKMIEKNVKKWRNVDIRLKLATVVSAYSLFRLDELFEWWGTDYNEHLIINLNFPDQMRITSLPPEIFTNCFERLKKYKHPRLKQILSTYSYVENERFLRVTKILDDIRNTDYKILYKGNL